jgi:hypothetical protein
MGSFFPDLFPASSELTEYIVFDQANPRTSAALCDWIDKQIQSKMEAQQTTNALVEYLKQRNAALEAQLALQTQQIHALSGATAVNVYLEAHVATLRQRIDALEKPHHQLSPRS